MLTFGGAVMAAYSVEHVNLHYRCALSVLNRISLRPQWWVIKGVVHCVRTAGNMCTQKALWRQL